MKKINLTTSAVFVLMFVFMCAVQAQTPQETLKQYISDLQKNPNDNTLKEKIIKHVQGMRQKPAIPEEARRHYVKAQTLLEDAKQPSDSADAAEEFRQALLVAPWWGEAYMKMGLALETAQRFDDAIASLKLFMATNPQGEVLRKTQDEIYKIEAKAQKAVKDKKLAAKKAVEDQRARQEAAEANKAKEQEDFLRKINGARYICRNMGKPTRLIIQGSSVTMEGYGTFLGKVRWGREAISYEIEGRSLRCFVDRFPGPGRDANPELDGFISDDGSTITIGKGQYDRVCNRER